MRYAVWVTEEDDELHYHVMKIEGVKSAEDLPPDVPRNAVVIDAESNGQALDIFIERRRVGAVEE